ncbi:Card1-like endonuclease domain-containing protein [Acidithiobacillus caldus]|jgi:hypothetical protein|uniref:Uncharacterized protein n=1 Tax=Acidithiobacillus caldus TaxID=33059 RepID=A0A1E7YKK6_9PROT|nr:DUF1887 family CARF protein [Acidithiobacillus caldus]OFC30311.1 hypothetical protein BAE27_11985 [Acidithiobacillus caldus]OFC37602.1 hypothetical protein BAE29_10390 [Acidithiobacillus caldus]OFC39189.1 hypothetical protein BAE28_04185 [Acidithiobacillus caldus]
MSWSDMFWEYLDHVATILDILVGGIALWGVFLPTSFWNRMRKYLRGNVHQGGEEVDTIAADGVIFTVSKKETPIWTMMKVRPNRVHLIGSRQTMEAVNSIKEFAHTANITISEAELNDADDVAEARQLVSHAINQLQQHGCKRIVIDVTGGKTPMSIGAFQAGDEANLPVIYVTAPFDQKLRHADLDRARIYVIREGRENTP